MSDDKASARKKMPAELEQLVTYAVQHPDQFKVITEQFAKRSQDQLAERKSAAGIQKLRHQFDLLTTPESFAPGQLVRWKEGLKNRTRPGYDEPAIVVEVLDEAVESSKEESSSTYYREPLDIVLGLIDDDDEMIVYHFDSRRFTAYEG